MATYKHGVYTSETATQLTVPIKGSAGLQVIFGTAPKATTKPILAYSLAEAKEALGWSDDWDTYTLCEAMDVCFNLLNIAPVIFVNVAPSDDYEDTIASDVVDAIEENLRKIYPMFGMTAGIISAPKWSLTATVAAKLQSACENINGVFSCECVVDLEANAYSEVKTKKEAAGLTSKHCVACFPQLKVGDKQYHMSAVVSALLAYTDAANGDVPNLSPSNKLVAGITGTCLSDGTEVVLDQSQANFINSAGIVTFLNINGFRCWGNNTCAYPASTDPKDRWIMVRRFFTWRSNSLILTYFQKVDNPANYRLIEDIVKSENINGNSYVAAGICAGYVVTFNDDENPITEILNGTIKFHINLAPFTPAEDIEFVLEFDPSAIENNLKGE